MKSNGSNNRNCKHHRQSAITNSTPPVNTEDRRAPPLTATDLHQELIFLSPSGIRMADFCFSGLVCERLRLAKVMAGRDGSVKIKGSDDMDDLPILNQEHLQSNMRVIHYSRTFMSIIGGVIAGILGLTSLMGFIFYFLVMGITSVGLAAKAGFSAQTYFDSWNGIILDGFLGGLMSFVLFWTFAYDIVHIF
ncbi:OLC1v1035145C1 [Oldenlandia corymbosa var. corymbosa]|uniref:ER membrane protein complex subunit 6 n=1 Tax=Oldenlandia corymbosa var. corymbosa TaxID=529605 RepID=A0AAV1CSD5_OLDCO|nr:OLC1v1035145C1 [Oldenlandia corymbosa var. corymbosa]